MDLTQETKCAYFGDVHVLPSEGSRRRALRPCLELLWTNMLSDTARTWPSTFTVVHTTTYGVTKASLQPVCVHVKPHFLSVHVHSHLKSPHVSGIPCIFQTVLITLEKEFQEKSAKERHKHF